MKKTPAGENSPAPFDQFKELARKLVQVPKAEADAKEANHRRKKAKKKRKRG